MLWHNCFGASLPLTVVTNECGYLFKDKNIFFSTSTNSIFSVFLPIFPQVLLSFSFPMISQSSSLINPIEKKYLFPSQFIQQTVVKILKYSSTLISAINTKMNKMNMASPLRDKDICINVLTLSKCINNWIMVKGKCKNSRM